MLPERDDVILEIKGTCVFNAVDNASERHSYIDLGVSGKLLSGGGSNREVGTN